MLDYASNINTFAVSASGCLRDSTLETTTIGGVSYRAWHLAPAFDMPVIALEQQV